MPGYSLRAEDSPLRSAVMATSLSDVIRACSAFPTRSVVLVVPTSTHVRTATAMWMQYVGAGAPPRIFTMSNLVRRLAALHLPDARLCTATEVSVLLRQAAAVRETSLAALGIRASDVMQWKADGHSTTSIRELEDEDHALPRRTRRILDVWDVYEQWKGAALLDSADAMHALATHLHASEEGRPFTLPGDATVVQGIVLAGVHALRTAELSLVEALATMTDVAIQWAQTSEDGTERARNFEQISQLLMHGWSFDHVDAAREHPLRHSRYRAQDRRDEVRAAMAVIKDGIVRGTRTLRDCCIVVPGAFHAYDDLIHDVARDAGVPLTTKERQRVSACAVSGAVLAALQLLQDGWRAADVERLVRSGFVDAPGDLDLATVMHVATRLRLRGGDGAEAWLQRIEQRLRTLYAIMQTNAEQDREQERERVLLERARRAVQWLREQCGEAPTEMTAADFTALVTSRIIEGLGMERRAFVRKLRADEIMVQSADAAALDVMREMLLTYAAMCDVTNIHMRPFEEHVAEFRRLLQEATVGVDDVRLQGITVASSADMLRGRTFSLVVMLGCIEGEFPPTMRESDDGLPIDLSAETAREDLADILAAVADTPEALLLATVPTSIDGADVIPSQLLAELDPDQHVNVDVLQADVIIGRSEAMLRDRTHGLDGTDRQHGILVDASDAQAMLQLRERVEPYVSPSRLDVITACPYRFAARYALRIPEQDRTSEGLTAAEKGQVLHAVVREFYTELQALDAHASLQDSINNGVDLLRWPVQELRQRCIRAYERIAPAYAVQHMYTTVEDRHFLGTETSTGIIERWLLLEVERANAERAQGMAFLPAVFEADVKAEVEIDETTVFVQGRIDRIDVWHDGGTVRFRVVDYKSSRNGIPSKPELRSGRASQMLLYTLAVQEQWKAEGIVATPAAAQYQSFGTSLTIRSKDEVSGPTFEIGDVVAGASDVAAAVHRMRAGAYPVSPSKQACQHCSFVELCRKDHWGTLA